MAAEMFSCPECKALLRYAPNLEAGAEVQCPKCNARFPVPDPAALPAPPPPRSEEFSAAPAPARPRFSDAGGADYSAAPRPPAYGGGREDYADEGDRDRPFTGAYSIDVNRWFALAGQHYSALLGPVIGFILVAGVLSFIPLMIVGAVAGAVSAQAGGGSPAQRFIVTQVIQQLGTLVLMPALVFPLWSGLQAVCLAQLKGRPWTFGDFFAGFQRYGAIAGVGLAAQLVTLVLISIPGDLITFTAVLNQNPQMLAVAPIVLLFGTAVNLFIQIRVFLFASIIVFDRGQGATQAMKSNWELTRGHFWGLFGVSFLLGLIMIGGVLACGVGVLFAVPYTLLILNAGYLLISDRRGPEEYRARYDD